MLGIATGAKLNANASMTHDIALIKQSGAKAVRFYVDQNEEFTDVDTILNALFAEGLYVLLGIGGSLDGHQFDARQIADFGLHGKAVAKRYGASEFVLGYEGANEANLPKADANPTAARYTACQKRLYESIKSVRPDAMVGTGGIIGSGNYLQELYEAGARPYFDMVCWHPYCRPITPTESMTATHGGWWAMHEAHRFMVANGDKDKEMWVTEFGSNTGGPEPFTDAKAATALEDAITRFRSCTWSGPFFHFTGWDARSGAKEKGDYMGLFRANDSEKPACVTFRRLARLN